MSRPRGSSKRSHERHENDPYVRRARAEGYRSRAVYKLEELLQGLELDTRRPVVVDLGAAPGGWSQYLARRYGDSATIVAIDLLPMEPLAGVTTLTADFADEAGLAALTEALNGAAADLVISDMAPNISGTRAVDQPRSMHLAELALSFAREVLADGGAFVCKLFQGEGFDEFIRDCRRSFRAVRIRKPKASRMASREVYVVARNYFVV
ncbi:MAG: RlmE family RNA methyltransferase [Pseudomonadota bacterium]